MAQTGRTTDHGPGGDTERRRYNRRGGPAELSPPYYEIFERIAVALEGIRRALEHTPPAGPGGTEGRMPAPRSE